MKRKWQKNMIAGILTIALTICLAPVSLYAGAEEPVIGMESSAEEAAELPADEPVIVNESKELGAVVAEDEEAANGPALTASSEEDVVTQVSLGYEHSAVIRKDGSLWLWGDNAWGEIGVGSFGGEYYEPERILEDVAQVSLGFCYSAAIKKDNSLWVWGECGSGELGNGTYGDVFRKSPKKIMDDVAQVSVNSGGCCAIKSDGSLWIWGGSYENFPTKIMKNAKQVSMGWKHIAALNKDGSLWMLGSNKDGQIGVGDSTSYDGLVKVMDDVIQVSAGDTCSLAIKADGSLWQWGGGFGTHDADGQLIPEKIMDDVKQICSGEYHYAAIKTDGSLWLWGGNEYGQLGNGNNEAQMPPQKVMDHVAQVSLGHDFSAALKEDGSLWLWGRNEDGQLGDGTTKNRTTPIQVMKPQSCIVKLNVNGGKCNVDSVTLDSGDYYGNSLPKATRSGYTFQGWYTAKSDEGSKIGSNSTVPWRGNETLYAHWKLSAPKIKSVTNLAYNKNKIQWSKVTGAAGYTVYRSGKAVKTIKSAKTTTWTDTSSKFTMGKTYSYQICANGKDSSGIENSSLGNKKTVKVIPSKPVLKKRTTGRSLVLYWAKQNKISGIYVYRADGDRGAKRIATLSKNTTSYTIKTAGLKLGTKYSFYIQTYYKGSSTVKSKASNRHTISYNR